MCKMMRAGWMALVVVGLSACAAPPSPQAGRLPESEAVEIEYATPGAAALALQQKPGVMMEERNGWVFADDRANSTMWSFPPKTDPAFPAVVKRRLYVEGNRVFIRMDVKCGGTKLGCDQMVLGFNKLNDQVKQAASKLPGYIGP